MSQQKIALRIPLLFLFILICLNTVAQNQEPVKDKGSPSWLAKMQSDLEHREYNISYDEGAQSYQSPNRVNNVRAHYNPGKLSLQNRVDSAGHNWKCIIKTNGVSIGNEEYAPEGETAINVEDNSNIIEFAHTGFTEQYINTKEGTRQNFIINKAPFNSNEIIISLKVVGLRVNQASENELHLYEIVGRKKEVRLVYKDLKSWDANGKSLTGSILYENGEIKLKVETTNATYPIIIDPIYTLYNPFLVKGQADASFGNSVSSVGDVNGDGYDDVIVGAPYYDNGHTNEGAAFVYLGSATGLNTTASNHIECDHSNANFGKSVSSAGDVNGDGFDDVIVGAPEYENGHADEGAAFIYLGSASGLSATFSARLEANLAHADFGTSVSSAGDVNGDGYDDVIVGAPLFAIGPYGAAYAEGAAFIYHGSSTGISSSYTKSIFASNFDEMGYSVSSAGDVNGDGYDDVIVGAPELSNGHFKEGAAFVFHGSSSGISSTVRNQLECNQSNADMGWSVSTAGDVNGDGYSDVIVGARVYDNSFNSAGAAFVYLGSSTGLSNAAVDSMEGDRTNAYLGVSVSTAGDVNGDGYSDIIVGAQFFSNGQTFEGAALVYHGSSTGISTTASIQMERNQADAYFGCSVSSAGDINGDGYSDVIIGASQFNNGSTGEGAAFVYYGSFQSVDSSSSIQMESNQSNAGLGFSVNSAGDVNGDGFGDVIVGAPDYDNGQTNEGAAFVYHGSSLGISNSASTQLECNQTNAQMGYSVSNAGDVNGDGFSDVIVGARSFANGHSAEGAAFVYHGSDTGLTTTASSQLEGNQTKVFFGNSVSTAGDVNGDGYSDVIVGSPSFDSDKGAAFIYHGSMSGLSSSFSITLKGNNQTNAFLGWSVSSAGDVNGDGYSDVIVGAPFYTNGQTNQGAAYIYNGSSTGISTATYQRLEKNQISAYLGYSVSSAGDVNGDGYSDVIVGASLYDNGQTDEGAAFIFHGSSSGVNTTSNTQLECNQANAEMGYSVSSAGDMNGDGYSDVIVGAHMYNNGETDEGAVFVYHGSPSGISTTASSDIERNQSSANLGGSVSSAGDVNGDGYSDVIIGSPSYTNGQSDEGAVFVLLGAAKGLSNAVGSQMESNKASAQLGVSVSSAGDVNGDGFSDVIVGATGYDNGQTDEGAVFVYHGSANGLNTTASFTQESNQISARLGNVSSAGDVNGDGYSDVIVGAFFYDNGQTNEGAAFVYYGSSTGLSSTGKHTLEGNHVQAYLGVSVSSAGDVNGDGYSDVIVGAYGYDNSKGAAFVYHGSASGIITTAHDTLESNQANAWMGNSVSSAGDVNGDGYSDVIVGDYRYDNGQTNEGAAFIYHGSASGLRSVASDTLQSNQADAQMGYSVSSAGDVNGDGYSDVIIGTHLYDNGHTDEGAAFVYHGSPTGLRQSPSIQLDGNQAGAKFGYSVSSAGDINSDGYCDVIIGAFEYDSGQVDEGAAFVYLGSSAGLIPEISNHFECNQANAKIGNSVSSAGDINGDGYSDIVVGAPYYDNGQTDEGVAFVYYGNDGGGVRNNLNLYDDNLTSFFTDASFSDANMGIGLFAKSPQGRQKGKIVYETLAVGDTFSSASPITNSTQFTGQGTSFTDLGIAGKELKLSIAKKNGPTRVRARVKYDPATSINGQVYGPWRYILVNPQTASVGALPVELTYFTAEEITKNAALLEWQTASELNNDKFEIERQVSGTSEFKIVGEIIGRGDSYQLLNYSFIDDISDISGRICYRIKQIDYDGKFEYSEVRCIMKATDKKLFIYPNPTTGVLNIELPRDEDIITINVLSINGQVLKELMLESSGSIDVSDLPNGVYIIKGYSINEVEFTQKLIVRK